MDEYIVYVRIDERNRIIAVNSSAFISDTTGWTEIDRGNGDRYHHAQGNYFDKPIFEEHGVPNYKLENGEAVERTQAEIEADIEDIPPDPPSPEKRIAELESMLETLLRGDTE